METHSGPLPAGTQVAAELAVSDKALSAYRVDSERYNMS